MVREREDRMSYWVNPGSEYHLRRIAAPKIAAIAPKTVVGCFSTTVVECFSTTTLFAILSLLISLTLEVINRKRFHYINYYWFVKILYISRLKITPFMFTGKAGKTPFVLTGGWSLCLQATIFFPRNSFRPNAQPAFLVSEVNEVTETPVEHLEAPSL